MDVMTCDLCGNEHPVTECKLFKDVKKEPESNRSTSNPLAYQTLPEWVSVQENPRRLITHKAIEKSTKFGPLLAPHSSKWNEKHLFPLCIQISNNIRVWLDQSEEMNSNWLSLVPASPNGYNLVALQVKENIYFISITQIEPNEQLKVWYAPFYKKKIPTDVMHIVEQHYSKIERTARYKQLCLPEKNEIGSSTIYTTNSTYDCKDQDIDNFYISSSNEIIYIDPISLSSFPNSKSLTSYAQSQSSSNISHNGFPANSFDSVPQVLLLPSYIPNIVYSTSNTDTAHNGVPVLSLLTRPESGNLSHTNQSNPLHLQEYYPENNAEGKLLASSSSIPEVSIQDPNSLKKQILEDSKRNTAANTHSNLNFNICNNHVNLTTLKSIIISKKRITFTHQFNTVNEDSCKKVNEGELSSRKVIHIKTGTKRHDTNNLSLNNTLSNIHLSQITEPQNENMHDIISLSVSKDPSSQEQLMTKVLNKLNSEARSSTNGESLDSHQSLTCLQCEETFAETSKLTNHLKNHLYTFLKKRLNCNTCGMRFKSKPHLEMHVLTHTMKNSCSSDQGTHNLNLQSNSPVLNNSHPQYSGAVPWKGNFSCQICLKVFTKAKYLLRHLSKHNREYLCSLCNKQFARNENLKKHYCVQSAESHYFICKICRKTFSNLPAFKMHTRTHEDNVTCTWCLQIFVDESVLNTHRRRCERNRAEATVKKDLDDSCRFTCHICNRKFSTSSFLSEHVFFCKQIAEVSGNGKGNCETCGEVYASPTEFRSHLQKHKYPYLCLSCVQRFRTRGTYELHICGISYPCDNCGLSLRSFQELLKHITSHGAPPLCCSLCRYPYYKMESLKVHKCSLELKEDGNSMRKKIPCTFCPSLFSTEHNLKKHMSSLHDVPLKQKFSCGKCGKSFNRSDLLKNHEKVHTQSFLQCHECHKRFRNRRSLALHSAALHHRDFRFSCSYCLKGFAQKKDFIRHELSHKSTLRPSLKAENDSKTSREVVPRPRSGSKATNDRNQTQRLQMENGSRKLFSPIEQNKNALHLPNSFSNK